MILSLHHMMRHPGLALQGLVCVEKEPWDLVVDKVFRESVRCAGGHRMPAVMTAQYTWPLRGIIRCLTHPERLLDATGLQSRQAEQRTPEEAGLRDEQAAAP